MRISFRVDGEPIPQPRPKVTGRGKFARAYVPAKHAVHAFRGSCAAAAAIAMDGMPPFDGAVRIEVEFICSRPKYMTAKKYGDGRLWNESRIDIDNLLKSTLDGLASVLYMDDDQVVEVSAAKYRAAIDEKPHTLVTVTPV